MPAFLVKECIDRGPGWSQSGRGRHADDATSPGRAPGTCSFAGDTGVLLADGSIKPIVEIKIGDQVRAADPDTGAEGARAVTAVWSHQDQLVDLQIGEGVVTTTEDHPFWNASDQTWQRADAIDAGEFILTADGDLVAVEGIDWATRSGGMAYNLTVADLHTYFVVVGDAEVLVHNTCGKSNYWKGREAERRAGIPDAGKERFKNASGKDRRPDLIDHDMKVVVEVKDLSGPVSYTAQLQDYQAYAQRENYRFILCTDSLPTAPLQREVGANRIELRTIDGCRGGQP
jgi:pretoxin HINT domain-containing protein/restriction endonuclease fold toxin 7 of polymorphic toxin system